ncbi:hypothetical protein O9993_18780 [Vibrio lentus]|nr:hypothetical protein [Vibrio lentus]
MVKEHIPYRISQGFLHQSGYEAYDKYGELGQKIFKAAIWGNHLKKPVFESNSKVISDLGRERSHLP